MDKQFRLQVDGRLTFSVNTQIKEQLKWLIGTGQVESGDLLPAASRLADSLGLNRNTVGWVYNQLQDEGLLVSRKGKGTQVADGAAVERLRKERRPMRRLLEDMLEEARTGGLNPHELFMAGLAYQLLRTGASSAAPRILLVECRGHDHPFYRKEIERITGREVRTVFLEDLNAEGTDALKAIGRDDRIVATLNEAAEVKAIFAPLDKQVHVIGATVEPAVLLDIARLQPDTGVSFVCLGKKGGEWMAQRVREAGISQIRSNAVGLHDREQMAEALSRSAKIFASAAVFPELKNTAPDKVELFRMRLERSSENLLRDLAASP